ncbi:MAG: hypothetical protein QHH27_09945, partial [Clostridia bacterium]|nr:hypothetical protein [Clostridia bacterium]
PGASLQGGPCPALASVDVDRVGRYAVMAAVKAPASSSFSDLAGHCGTLPAPITRGMGGTR